jgi:hypothetical protein
MDRAAYIQTLKNLIMKYHPDHCQDKSLERLYSEITIKLNQKLEQAKAAGPQEEAPPGAGEKPGAAAPAGQAKHPGRESSREPPPAPPGPVVSVKDQSYAYYRQGIRYYRNIHPDQFYRRLTRTTFAPIGRRRQLEILEKIFLSFNLARRYFKHVIDNFPDSPWRGDSLAKIALLDKLRKSYEQRIKSFRVRKPPEPGPGL